MRYNRTTRLSARWKRGRLEEERLGDEYNMTNRSIDILFEKAIQVRDSGNIQESIALCKELTNLYPENSGIAQVFTVMAGMFFDLKDFNNSCLSFRKATELKPHYELASLGLYLSLCEMEKYPEAIEEIKRYLNRYPANSYKTTLEELLGDLDSGYALDYKEIILDLAAKHSVESKSKE